jgi:hypothetical protein
MPVSAFMSPRHIKNVWANKPKPTPDGRLRTGGPPITITGIKLGDESCTTDHVGTTVTLTQIANFYGTWDAVYLAANASALGFPWYGDYAVGASGLIYCSHTSVKYVGGLYTSSSEPGTFNYTSTFSPITPDRLDLSPLDRPAIVTGGGIELTEVRRQDVNAHAMVNSVGDYYEGLPEFYIPGSELQVAWNVSSNPMTTAQTYSFSTNSAAIWGQSTYSGVIGKISFEQTFETYQGSLIQFYRLTVPFKFRNDGLSWNFQPFDYGYRYLVSGTPQNYIDPVSGVYGPIFLDGSGHLLNGTGATTTGTGPVIFPAASGSTPAGYQTLTGLNWSGLSCPINPFA